MHNMHNSQYAFELYFNKDVIKKKEERKRKDISLRKCYLNPYFLTQGLNL